MEHNPNSPSSLALDACAFIVPALAWVQFNLIGTLFLTDLLLVVMVPILLTLRKRVLSLQVLWIGVSLTLLWLFAQVFTDVVRESSPDDYLRGWTKIVLTITHFVAIFALVCDSLNRLQLYALGLTAGSVITVLFFPNAFTAGDPWKFSLAMPVTLVVTAAVDRFGTNRPKVGSAVLLTLSVLHFWLGSRSIGALTFLTMAYSFFVAGGSMSLRGSRAGKTLLVGFGGIACVALVTIGFEYAALNGFLDDKAKEKVEMQSGEAGLLLGGRSEVLASGAAIADSPFIGHGSWARNIKYALILQARRIELGYPAGQGDFESDLIPSHSHILGAWVEAGVLGIGFWLWALWRAGNGLIGIRTPRSSLQLFTFSSLMLGWDLLFSPYGADRRFTTTFYICVVLACDRAAMLNRPSLERRRRSMKRNGRIEYTSNAALR